MAATFAALSLVLLVLPPRFREALAHGVRSTVLLPFFALQRGTADREGHYEDAAYLRAQRDSLAAFLVGQAGLAAENRSLRALLGFKSRLGFPFVPAEAVHLDGPGKEGTMLLSVGTSDGVRDGMPVVTAEGLVGMVSHADGRGAVAIDWTNPEFRASVTTVDGRAYGIAEPHPEGGRHMLVFSPNALHAAPDSGALMVTSGDGQTYPRGIPVGKVVRAAAEQGTWQKSYYIEPLVSPTAATHVLLLGQPAPSQSVQDLAGAWGIRLTGAPPADSAAVPGGVAAQPPAAAAPAPAAPAATKPKPARPRPKPGTRLLGRPVTQAQPQTPPETTRPPLRRQR